MLRRARERSKNLKGVQLSQGRGWERYKGEKAYLRAKKGKDMIGRPNGKILHSAVRDEGARRKDS